MIWEKWVLDVTLEPCFCPYDENTGDIVVGLNLLSDECPGELVGVVHADGQEAVEKWIAENPNWREKYHGKEQR